MAKTAHMAMRMAQRGIKREMVDLAIEYGEIVGDRHVLSTRQIHDLIEEKKQELKALQHAQRKGGITVVEVDGNQITTFRTNSFRASAIKNIRR